MKKPLAFALVFVAVVIGSVTLILALKPSRESIMPKEVISHHPEEQTHSDTSSDSDNQEAPQAGVYKDYSETALAQAQGQVVIFFHAPWCPQCRSLEASIESNGVPDGYTILRTDYDSSTELKKKYNVKIQTTLVKVDKNGNFIDSFVAYDNPTIKGVTKDFLELK